MCIRDSHRVDLAPPLTAGDVVDGLPHHGLAQRVHERQVTGVGGHAHDLVGHVQLTAGEAQPRHPRVHAGGQVERQPQHGTRLGHLRLAQTVGGNERPHHGGELLDDRAVAGELASTARQGGAQGLDRRAGGAHRGGADGGLHRRRARLDTRHRRHRRQGSGARDAELHRHAGGLDDLGHQVSERHRGQVTGAVHDADGRGARQLGDGLGLVQPAAVVRRGGRTDHQGRHQVGAEFGDRLGQRPQRLGVVEGVHHAHTPHTALAGAGHEAPSEVGGHRPRPEERAGRHHHADGHTARGADDGAKPLPRALQTPLDGAAGAECVHGLENRGAR